MTVTHLPHRLQLFRLPDIYAVCRLAPTADVPTWAMDGAFHSVTRTADELSVVCDQQLVPPDVRCESNWKGWRVAGPIDFGLVGVVASLVQPLAEAGVSVFVLSTFDTDYLLVKATQYEQARTAVLAAGHVECEPPRRG